MKLWTSIHLDRAINGEHRDNLAPTNKSANILTETGNPTNPYEFITPEVADYRRGLAQQTHDQNLAYKAELRTFSMVTSTDYGRPERK